MRTIIKMFIIRNLYVRKQLSFPFQVRWWTEQQEQPLLKHAIMAKKIYLIKYVSYILLAQHKN